MLHSSLLPTAEFTTEDSAVFHDTDELRKMEHDIAALARGH